MERVLPILALVAFGVAWHWFLHKKSGGRSRSPLWGAFTATAVAILFLVAGAAGYKLSHGVPFTIGSAWTDQVIWSEIWVGAGVALIAVYLWRLGVQSLRSSH
jgi:hypothetical protein